MPTEKVLRSAELRLLARLTRAANRCWEWAGPVDRDGYGLLQVNDIGSRAHRVAYRVFRNELSGARCVCHSCDNPRCCNPAHLFLGSDADNARDRDRKGRGPRGAKNHFAKLTAEKAQEIRRHLNSGRGQSETARLCGVSVTIVHNIARGKAWRHGA